MKEYSRSLKLEVLSKEQDYRLLADHWSYAAFTLVSAGLTLICRLCYVRCGLQSNGVSLHTLEASHPAGYLVE